MCLTIRGVPFTYVPLERRSASWGAGDMATTAISPHAHACSVAVHCNRVLLVLCLAKTDACYLAAVASQSQKSIPGSALHDQCLPGLATRALQHLLQQKARHLAALCRPRIQKLFAGLRVREIICIERIEVSRQC